MAKIAVSYLSIGFILSLISLTFWLIVIFLSDKWIFAPIGYFLTYSIPRIMQTMIIMGFPTASLLLSAISKKGSKKSLRISIIILSILLLLFGIMQFIRAIND